MVVSHKCTRRRGTSLVELVAVIIAGSAVMGIAIAVLVALQRADQRFTRRGEWQQSIALLAEQLRRDVHSAERVAWNSEVNELSLEAPDGARVAYRREGRRWERRVSSGAEQEPQLAGAFRLPARVECSVEPVDAKVGVLVRVSWTTGVKPRDPWRAGAPRYEFAAVVGRDLSLLYP